MRTLTGVYAHPDDETFSAGGTFARYAAQDVRCTIFCATDGDAGKTSGLAVASKAELGALRRNEMQAAARILGIDVVESPGHPDGGLRGVDQDALIGEIVLHFRRERPDVVVTFGPEGAPNTHADHRVISRAATAAFFLSGNPTAFAEHLRVGVEPHAPRRLFYVTWAAPGPESDVKAQGVRATAFIDVRQFRDIENTAWRAHASQQSLQARFDEFGATDVELFGFVAGTSLPAATVESLFAGL